MSIDSILNDKELSIYDKETKLQTDYCIYLRLSPGNLINCNYDGLCSHKIDYNLRAMYDKSDCKYINDK